MTAQHLDDNGKHIEELDRRLRELGWHSPAWATPATSRSAPGSFTGRAGPARGTSSS